MRKLKCFVIMPSGNNPPTRLVPDSKDGLAEAASSQAPYDIEIAVEFNKVYKRIVEKAILQVNASQSEAKMEWHNSDTLPGGANLIPNLVKAICCADITITDVTGLNPNVLFELGIRLSVRDSLNILLRHKGVELPFDIFSQKCIDYALDVDSGDTAADNIAKEIQQTMPALLENAQNTADNLFRREVELSTGRKLEKQLTEAFEPSEQLVTDLLNEVRRLGGVNPKLRDQSWNFLENLAKTLLVDPLGHERAIRVYRLLTTLEGFREKRRDVFYQLNEICAADPNRKQEAQDYLDQAKALEN